MGENGGSTEIHFLWKNGETRVKGPKMPLLARRLGEGVTNGPQRGGGGDGGKYGEEMVENPAKEKKFFG